MKFMNTICIHDLFVLQKILSNWKEFWKFNEFLFWGFFFGNFHDFLDLLFSKFFINEHVIQYVFANKNQLIFLLSLFIVNMLEDNFNDTSLLYHANNSAAFDILKYAEEHKDWYEHCMDVLESHKLTLNTSENNEYNNDTSISLTQHFNQPTDTMCQQLVEFTANPVSVFGDSTRKTMITVYS